MSRTIAGLAAAFVTWVAAPASAYTVASAATEGCHERICSEALRRVRERVEAAGPIRPTDDEQALIDDLQFDPDDDMRDLGAVALLLGVRDNDLKGRGSDDLTELANVHGDPATQDEHCLRGLHDDEPDGTVSTVGACRRFIERRVDEALDALDASGEPTKRASLEVHLAIRGGVEVPLPAFYVRMGQALHALQDGFTHTYRTDDGRRVTVALNWLEVANGELDEPRDGPPHSEALDDCDGEAEVQKVRLDLAIEASTRLLEVAIATGPSREEKRAAVSAILDDYFGVSSGCTYGNAWCDAAEADLPAPGCGCAVVGDEGSRGGAAAVALGLCVAVVAARRSTRGEDESTRRGGKRGARGVKRGTKGVGVVAMLGVLAWSGTSTAMAQDAEPAPSPAPGPLPFEPVAPPTPGSPAAGEGAPAGPAPTGDAPADEPVTPKEAEKAEQVEKGAIPPPRVVPVGEPGPADPDASTWGFAVHGGGSIDKAGFAVGAGGRFRLDSTWTFGLDGEWNPYISATGGEPVRTGSANIYLSGILRYPLHYEKFNMRSNLSLGTSILLNDLYAAPTGSTGLFVGANFLGIEYKASEAFYLVINPLGVAIPIPQIGGIPFLYPQYRLSLAIEVYAG